MQVAIDGPGGSGKSTLSRNLAKRLGFVYVDTGALYRAVGLFCSEKGVGVNDEEEVRKTIEGKLKLSIKLIDGEQRVFSNGEDVSEKIRRDEVSMWASDVSKLPFVREFLLKLQRDMAETNSVIMDGRDIGTVILPNADVKIFLTAADTERAKRRHEELIEKGAQISYSEVLEELRKRDHNDTHREIAPLKQAKDAVLIDSTGLSFEQTAQKLYETIVAARNEAI
ncbi:MAG: (d)CMP kinase [Oscillospiraceae bacterium]|nr:(d)CMP kinase [Oscillospiraceae bacterium]